MGQACSHRRGRKAARGAQEEWQVRRTNERRGVANPHAGNTRDSSADAPAHACAKRASAPYKTQHALQQRAAQPAACYGSSYVMAARCTQTRAQTAGGIALRGTGSRVQARRHQPTVYAVRLCFTRP